MVSSLDKHLEKKGFVHEFKGMSDGVGDEFSRAAALVSTSYVGMNAHVIRSRAVGVGADLAEDVHSTLEPKIFTVHTFVW